MLHSIKATTTNKDSKRIGRGGKRGKTSGRGTKGQWAHGGHGVRPEIRDMIKKLPKLRGRGISPNKSIAVPMFIINLSRIEAAYTAGEAVNAQTLVAKGFLSAHKGIKADIKILAHGELTKKLSFEGCLVSTSARVKIEAAGGSVE